MDFRKSLIDKYSFLPRRPAAIAVPEGWQHVVVALTRQCAKIFPRSTWGEGFRILAIRERAGNLEASFGRDVPMENIALAGALRKYKRRAGLTCCSCGSPTIPWHETKNQRPTCPNCAAGPMLREALATITQWNKDEPWARPPFDPTAIPWLLRKDFQEWLAKQQGNGGELPRPWELSDWMAGLVQASRSRVIAGRD